MAAEPAWRPPLIAAAFAGLSAAASCHYFKFSLQPAAFSGIAAGSYVHGYGCGRTTVNV